MFTSSKYIEITEKNNLSCFPLMNERIISEINEIPLDFHNHWLSELEYYFQGSAFSYFSFILFPSACSITFTHLCGRSVALVFNGTIPYLSFPL